MRGLGFEPILLATLLQGLKTGLGFIGTIGNGSPCSLSVRVANTAAENPCVYLCSSFTQVSVTRDSPHSVIDFICKVPRASLRVSMAT